MSDLVYLVYIPHIPKMFQVRDEYYGVVVKNDTAILQIPKKLKDEFMRMKAGCCGYETRAFREASPVEVEKWLS